MSAQDAYDKAAVDFAHAEKKGREFVKLLSRVMLSTLKVQHECECADNDKIHPINFDPTLAKLGEAMAAATGAVEALAEAHKMGDDACDGGPIVAGGGGGK